ncbi:MAG: TetR family transcriptional regulator [Microthrixaceae bacterium]
MTHARVVATREQLLDAAEELFGRQGIDRTPTREIVEAARQRNASAVSYHFGSREGLLLEILARRGGQVDAARGSMHRALGASPTTSELVNCLVEPYVALLDEPGGRSYLRIVDRLRGTFAAWRVESDAATTKHLVGILDELERRAGGPSVERAERVVAMIMLLTSTTAEQARQRDDGQDSGLAGDRFRALLVSMCSAVLAG